MNCPNCHTSDVGKIGAQQFYCWNCFIELSVEGGKMRVHEVQEDKTVSSLDDLFSWKVDFSF
ncbi:hypothetical protein [Alkalibacillus silvisoli]|uniref:DUF2797 domain-containing protein n=1 Tax=Alkalibacillus silvisoli TaxID=392823 RepID=A0ABN0ZS67_9BACI